MQRNFRLTKRMRRDLNRALVPGAFGKVAVHYTGLPDSVAREVQRRAHRHEVRMARVPFVTTLDILCTPFRDSRARRRARIRAEIARVG